MVFTILSTLCRSNSMYFGKITLIPRSVQANPCRCKRTLINNQSIKKIRFYFLKSYIGVLTKFSAVLEKRFPKTFGIYSVFMEGFKEFYQDTKTYFQLTRTLSKPGGDLNKFTLAQLELYYQMPKDMRRIAPTLLLAVLPFGFYALLPLIVYFPRQTLSKQFWNLQQKSEFNVVYLQGRLKYNKPIFRLLQEHLRSLKGHPLHKNWSNVLGQIGSGVQPSVEQILECKPLFTEAPYHLSKLSRKHIRLLLKLNNQHTSILGRYSRLVHHAVTLKAMDNVIEGMGGPQQLSTESLKFACLIRGLNPTNMKKDDINYWLAQWMQISQQTDKSSYSLLLHCPILLGYNEPSNWLLIYKPKDNILANKTTT